MKSGILLLLCLACNVSLWGQEKMYIHKSDKITLGALISETDSVYFSSDDYINILTGNITVSGAITDGIHSNDYFKMSGGTLNVTATGDGIQCEDGYILISGGTITTVNSAADIIGITCDIRWLFPVVL